jgi:hypothetical protein
MRRFLTIAATTGLLAAMGGCGSSGGASTTSRLPRVPTAVMHEVVRRAQEDMRERLHDVTIVVREIRCRQGNAVAYACELQLTDATRVSQIVEIYLEYHPDGNRVAMAFTDSTNRAWARILTHR